MTPYNTGLAATGSQPERLKVPSPAAENPEGQEETPARRLIGFDFDWKFHLGDVDSGQSAELNDEGWRTLNLPHDWSIEGTFDMEHPTGAWGGFLPCGIAWYRKTFDIPHTWADRQVRIEFDGIYMNSEVWINGSFLGRRPNGYIGFEYDLTPYLRPNGNVIAVRVDTSREPSSRWYSGSGIYRHVSLTVTGPVRVAHWGTCVTTPSVAEEAAVAEIRTTVENTGRDAKLVRLVSEISDAEGRLRGMAFSEELVPGNGQIEAVHSVRMEAPDLWSPEQPSLYTLKTRILDQDGISLLDEYSTRFGIRSISFRPGTGFFLNGKSLKLKGVCHHHDAGPVGSAVPDKVLERRLLILKQMGCNAIRTAHHPMAPEFYDLCDRLGLMVIDEAFDGWGVPKADCDYGLYFDEWWRTDLLDMLRRDRNHPCIILWSIGNEVLGKTDEMTREIQDFVHRHEPTRPVTCGRGEDGILDVQGYNGHGGQPGVLEEAYRMHPERVYLLTEEPHTLQTRGFYRTQTWWRDKDRPRFEIANLTEDELFFDGALEYNSSYDNSGVRCCARDSWRRTKELDYVCGEFRWTGFDYLGESAGWPARMGNYGIIDLCGFPKDTYYFYQSLWADKPMVHVLPHWTHPGLEGTVIPVWAYSNCDSVEVLLNGVSLGEQPVAGRMNLAWDVPYAPGRLEAIGRKNGKIVDSKAVETASHAAVLRLQADQTELVADGRDISHVVFELRDEDDRLVPHADNEVTFCLRGPAQLIGLENGDPVDLTPAKSTRRKAFYGKGIGIVQSVMETGDIELAAVGILGDTLFQTSKTVHISVARISLRGILPQRTICIHYTLDGSEPSPSSPEYVGSFELEQSCLVRAAVYMDGVPIASVQAAFKKGIRRKVIDSIHGNRKEHRGERPLGPFAAQLAGSWSYEKGSYRFAGNGDVVWRLTDTGEEKRGSWWYDFPEDPLESPDYAGKGEIWWKGGTISKLALQSQTGEALRVQTGKKAHLAAKHPEDDPIS
jgi:beta-galactosidase